MTLEALYYLSQIIAVVLILGSLVFVGVEIRQNTLQARQSNAIAKADLSERLLAKFNDVWSIISTDEVVSKAFATVLYKNGKLSQLESVRLLTWFSNVLNTHFNAFLLMRDELVDDKMLSAFDNNTAWCLSFPLFEAHWAELLTSGLDFSPEFVAHVQAKRRVWTSKQSAPGSPPNN
ncbi:MAG: hypothetical protein AAFX03_00525 [Pseudomonadota bacterium]